MRSYGGGFLGRNMSRAREKEGTNRGQQMKGRVADGKYPLPGGQRFCIGFPSAFCHARYVL